MKEVIIHLCLIERASVKPNCSPSDGDKSIWMIFYVVPLIIFYFIKYLLITLIYNEIVREVFTDIYLGILPLIEIWLKKFFDVYIWKYKWSKDRHKFEVRWPQ